MAPPRPPPRPPLHVQKVSNPLSRYNSYANSSTTRYLCSCGLSLKLSLSGECSARRPPHSKQSTMLWKNTRLHTHPLPPSPLTNTRFLSPDELAISFNGGKDCLVLLILFLAGLARPVGPSGRHKRTPQLLVNAVYVMSAHPFPEVDAFVDLCVPGYHLGLARYALPMREAFETYLREKPGIKAIFVGTRRTDPHGEFLTHFDQTDHGWPEFMRVHPVIDWHYQEVWTVSFSLVVSERRFGH